MEEAGGATIDLDRFPSLTLDEENCIIHYDGTKDQSGRGVKGRFITAFRYRNQGNVSKEISLLDCLDL